MWCPFAVGRRREGCRSATAFDCVLQCIVESIDPAMHVFFGRGLVYSLKLGCDNFEAKSSFSVAGFSNGRHPQVNRLHMQVQPLLPIAVLG